MNFRIRKICIKAIHHYFELPECLLNLDIPDTAHVYTVSCKKFNKYLCKCSKNAIFYKWNQNALEFLIIDKILRILGNLDLIDNIFEAIQSNKNIYYLYDKKCKWLCIPLST